jgi:hypothetical protein
LRSPDLGLELLRLRGYWRQVLGRLDELCLQSGQRGAHLTLLRLQVVEMLKLLSLLLLDLR